MRRIIITALLIIVSLNIKAQFSCSYYAGYGFYNMSNMKDLMNSAVQIGISSGSLPPHAKLVGNFPPFIMHSADAGYRFSKNEAGLKFSFMTTGSKIAVADYSGSYNEKLVTNGYRIGGYYRYYFNNESANRHSISPFVELSPALTNANMKTSGRVVIYNSDNTTTTEDAPKLKETRNGFSAQPLVGVRFKLYNHFLLTVSTGYDFEFGANLGNNYRMDFSRFRINAGIGFTL